MKDWHKVYALDDGRMLWTQPNIHAIKDMAAWFFQCHKHDVSIEDVYDADGICVEFVCVKDKRIATIGQPIPADFIEVDDSHP